MDSISEVNRSAAAREPSFSDAGSWTAVFSALTARVELSAVLVQGAVSEILSGNASAVQIAAFAIGMRTKGETTSELAAALATMREFAVAVPLADSVRQRAICTCGTGGDRSHSINISTTAAFVVAGAGSLVCKHGGRASSSLSGSADVLEALGVTLDVSPEGIAACIDSAGIGFCLAPRFHPAMRHAAPVRRELGVATMFNVLGPLANPGNVSRQMVGVSDPAMAMRMIEVLKLAGATHAWVVHGRDHLDEITTTTTTDVIELKDGVVTEFVIDPLDYGIERSTLEQLRGGTAEVNAAYLRRVLEGERGPHRDIVVLNAAAGLLVAGGASDLRAGLALAERAVDSGAALGALENLVRTSKEFRVSS
jgi:anthranilate phosphoribosyltransferase